MKKQSLVDRVVSYLKTVGTFVHGGELERLALQAGYKSSNVSRRCRELVEEGVLERKENEKGHVLYRYKQPIMSQMQLS